MKIQQRTYGLFNLAIVQKEIEICIMYFDIFPSDYDTFLKIKNVQKLWNCFFIQCVLEDKDMHSKYSFMHKSCINFSEHSKMN